MIEKKLKTLGVDIEREKINVAELEKLPLKIRYIVDIYRETILFTKNVYSEVTGKERFPIDMLWGIELSDYNIFSQNERFVHINEDKNLYSFGGTLSGDHVCLSLSDGCVYYFKHDDSDPVSKVCGNVEAFFQSLFVYEDVSEDDDGVIDCHFDF